MAVSSTRERILESALAAFGTDGYAATSLDALADQLGVRKQTILYYFPSKQALFDAVIDDAAADLVKLFDTEASRGLDGIDQVEAIVRRVFRLAVRRPELLGLVREVSRPGSITADRLGSHVAPIFERARDFLQREMDAGRLRRSDPSMLLLSIYSTVVGVATELEVQRAMGMAPTLRATVGRRQELLRFLRAALLPPGSAQ
ncbi:MAG: TetR/AcrR family transcriptional regulator [Actinobacteria bacterium]|nr:TetR/AcrR family transcriptional regulator [Actinomycetota bacterium]NIS28475.1 TetR/AcrR family transcriptional regulator [Actinomycetota bacterium]NIT93965.1 TetR/AcrR family transcriptional regulator [Actinomycetota bacterium]NIU17601.1 TetR/AcrR family transcriptional regulator [Actinomycetota bacterium]NIU63950.1 TetR/AcrR family transcriptional regulator [Actinomycetota bacterium]